MLSFQDRHILVLYFDSFLAFLTVVIGVGQGETVI